MDKEVIHWLIEGLFAIILAMAGAVIKTLWSQIVDIRRSIQDTNQKANELELKIEREFVRHSDMVEIKGTLASLNAGQQELITTINDLKVAMARQHARHREEDE